MEQSIEQRSLTCEQSIIAVDRNISSSLTEKGSHFHDTLKVRHKFSQPFLDPDSKFTQTKSTEHVIQFKSFENNPKPMTGSKVYNDNELVKQMSNVPSFLQQVGKEKSIQEKALNFGVLDWKRLEKWKYNERMPVRIHKKTSSSSTGSICMGSGPPKMSPNLRMQPSSHGLDIDSQFGPPQRKPITSQNSDLNPFKMGRKDTCSREENYFVGIRQPGNLETPSQEFRGVQRRSVDMTQKFHHRVESYDSCSEPNLNKVKMKDKNRETIPERKPRSLEQGKNKISFSSNDTIHGQWKTSEKSMDDGMNHTHMGVPPEMQNFLLVSKHFPKRSCSENSQFSEPRMFPRLSYAYTAVRSSPVMEVTTGADSIDKEKASSSSKGRSSPLRRLLDPIDKEKTNSSSKGRSSPLRRLLDPLLKKKDSQPTNIVQPPNGTMATRGLCQDRKPEGLSSKGLLQLLLKNGLPYFKLVVENSSNDMLAAVVKKLPALGKSDHCMVYTFYSIHEVRKKNMTWIQGSKSKRCDIGCNILGQMKISNIRLPKSRAKSSDVCAVRECVLYGVDKEQVDEEEPEFLPGKERAAVVLQNSCQKLNDRELNDNKKLYQDENTDSAVVILPGGVHGMPNKGAPSSLISRWRSGGCCDCGGWDVGCKLRVLTNHSKKVCKILESSMSCSTTDRVNLFVQGREQNSKPAFNLEAFSNGFYSLELDSSIPLLEAFATCVALLTSQKFSEILDTNIPGHILEAIIGSCKPNTTTTTTFPFSRQVPAKFATYRPPSPVGRI